MSCPYSIKNAGISIQKDMHWYVISSQRNESTWNVFKREQKYKK